MRVCFCELSLILRSEEEAEEKGPGFSRLRMCLIAVEFHPFRILMTYFRILVMPILILHVILSVTIAAYGV